jgi:hypothetical protein
MSGLAPALDSDVRVMPRFPSPGEASAPERPLAPLARYPILWYNYNKL